MLLSLVLVAGLGACGDGVDRLLPPPAAPDMPGPFDVGHSSFTAIDPLRDNRMLAVEVWYPVDAAQRQDAPLTRYPLGPGIDLQSSLAIDDLPVSARQDQTLLVFSHGYGGINTASVVLMEVLASHGFVVVSPEHTGNSQSSGEDSFDQAAANRVPDVSFLIDTMLGRSATQGDAFYGRLDAGRVGVLGHSFGGMTAVGMAAGWAGAQPDPRVAAIVPISAVFEADLQSDEREGPNAGFTRQQLERIDVPVLLMGGTDDIDVFIENNNIAFAQLANAPRVYQVDIIGANHTHFANVCDIGNLLLELGLSQDLWPTLGAEELLEPYALTCSPEAFPIEEVVRLQNLFIVSFFRRHLLDDERYDRYLDEGFAAEEAAIAFRRK
ncbi:MAG: CocE/NonD family hydrolase [Halioglobus sp.]|nr:CocE/NonD family hydrolase [Halioglobus sp.]